MNDKIEIKTTTIVFLKNYPILFLEHPYHFIHSIPPTNYDCRGQDLKREMHFIGQTKWKLQTIYNSFVVRNFMD